MYIQTKPCHLCKEPGVVEIKGDDTVLEQRWEQHAREHADFNSTSPLRFIQNAFPELTPDQREQIISGTHPKCWAKMFGDDE